MSGGACAECCTPAVLLRLVPAGKLRPIAEALSRMSAEDRAMYRLPEDALGAIHYRSIERIYGDSVSFPVSQPSAAVRSGSHLGRGFQV